MYRVSCEEERDEGERVEESSDLVGDYSKMDGQFKVIVTATEDDEREEGEGESDDHHHSRDVCEIVGKHVTFHPTSVGR